ncbi:MAG: lamin tail domain-containing protein [Bacteroidales bacterium]|nr:lamin tail domain-containing protein [Bacteroidales bacterium]
MKNICLLLLIFPSLAFSQVNDDFNDGNFTKNPEWVGDTLNFEVNASDQLHLHTTGSDTSVLFTRSETVIETEWDFWLKLSFNTSANNYARIYLSIDTLDVSVANGYFFQAGGADDSLRIIRKEGNLNEIIFTCTSYRTVHNTNALRIKIKRDIPGNWEVLIDTTGGANYRTDGFFFDNVFTTSRWFGVSCRYTSSNSTKFYFDDFYVGPVIRDTISPIVNSLEVLGENHICVSFSEIIPEENAENTFNYRLTVNGNFPDSVVQDQQQPSKIDLFFKEAFPEGKSDTLAVHGIVDLAGNSLKDTLIPISFYQYHPYDVVIHEILADPEPSVALPEGEFVELFNRTPYPINLKGWIFKFGNFFKIFPFVVIQPKGYLLIVRDPAYFKYGNAIVLFTSSTSLANEGSSLVLKDSKQRIIHSVNYELAWFRGSFKAEGGWSLEMIDPSNPCGCIENWNASQHCSGGTPGEVNSIQRSNPDLVNPYLVRGAFTDPDQINVCFSESIDSTTIREADSWEVLPGFIQPDSVFLPGTDYRSVGLHFSSEFEPQTIYQLKLKSPVYDCAGNGSDTGRFVRIAIPASPASHDVVINEILSDPVPGSSRFVELYNRSDKVLDLLSLVISRQDTIMGFLPGSVQVCDQSYLLFPGDHIALTPSPQDILEKYRTPCPDAVIMTKDFPAFDEDSGIIILARKDNFVVIDKVHYQPSMHYPLLATREGVSLERVNPDRPSFDETNWHSAAETAGFATPGYLNSHGIGSNQSEGEFSVTPGLFSPDNDGRDDLVNIGFENINPDVALTLSVYDSHGRLIRLLANNILLSSQENFSWDGMTSNQDKAPMGPYIIFAEMTNPDGKIARKKTVVFLCGKP